MGMEQLNCFWQASVCGCRVSLNFMSGMSEGMDMSIDCKRAVCSRKDAEKVYSLSSVLN